MYTAYFLLVASLSMHHTHYCYQYLQQSSDKHFWCFIHDFTNLLWAALCMLLTIFSSISSPPLLPLPTYLLAFCHPLGSWPQQVFSIIHGTQVQVKLRQLCLHFWTVLLATTKYFRVKCCSLAFALSWVIKKTNLVLAVSWVPKTKSCNLVALNFDDSVSYAYGNQ